MDDPATAPWGLSISNADFEKLRAGFEPRDMDDKWAVSATDPDQSGNISIRVRRSWTGKEHYILAVKPSDGGSRAQIEAITWEQNKGGIYISECLGKKEAVMICRGLLGCDFDTLPYYDPSLLWNHPAAQIGASYEYWKRQATNVRGGR
ncbi:uncharacterized protein BDZ99DRAFT_252032 [Mytilinidion resinicola]|uniref:Uncharacterized protein n=1 Tax=Mytilinidion resinicola TaxID=574789 RepID=A0A6A6YXF1_9PEZI|nr:uncharacterized protein BDZ99DRAFT_252032 [Mytilinidion resinicola]KAF2813238.1 hypothetical protein BDZ99DRAFT_252032 [Mytilinidion resinicola]